MTPMAYTQGQPACFRNKKKDNALAGPIGNHAAVVADGKEIVAVAAAHHDIVFGEY